MACSHAQPTVILPWTLHCLATLSTSMNTSSRRRQPSFAYRRTPCIILLEIIQFASYISCSRPTLCLYLQYSFCVTLGKTWRVNSLLLHGAVAAWSLATALLVPHVRIKNSTGHAADIFLPLRPNWYCSQLDDSRRVRHRQAGDLLAMPSV